QPSWLDAAMVPVRGPALGHSIRQLEAPVSYLTAVLGSISSCRLQASEDLSTLVPDCCSSSMQIQSPPNLVNSFPSQSSTRLKLPAAKLDAAMAGHALASDKGSSAPRSKMTMGFPVRPTKVISKSPESLI